MGKEDIKLQIDNLIDKINYHIDKYYNQDTPEISDFEYDMLMKELIKLEAENPEFKRVDSPSNRVGGWHLISLTRLHTKIRCLVYQTHTLLKI